MNCAACLSILAAVLGTLRSSPWPAGRVDARPPDAVRGLEARRTAAVLRAARAEPAAGVHILADRPGELRPAAAAAAGVVPLAARRPPCSASESTLRVVIQTDDFGEDTTWRVVQRGGDLIASGGPYPSNTLIVEEVCLDPARCYDFTLDDVFTDGLLPPGYFEVYLDDVLLDRGGAFGASVQVRAIGTCAVNPLRVCDAGPGDSHRPHQPTEGWFAGLSEIEAERARFIRADQFSVPAAVCRVSWWGFQARLTFFDIFSCDDPANEFVIAFHADADGVPGEVVCSYTVTAAGVPTGMLYLDQFEALKYDVELPNCCNVRDGWVSIAGKGDVECWAFLISTPWVDGQSWVWNDDLETYDPGDLAFCLAAADEPGACCNPFDATCQSGVAPADCPPGFEFTPGVECEALDPPCGGVPGACCDDANGECVDDVLPANCLTRHTPGMACADLDPACGEAPGACCFPDGRACEPLAIADCQAAGGEWRGAGAACDVCPCVVGCPPGAIQEQDDCGVDTNYGCFGDPPSFQDIQLGDTICGRGFAVSDRDTDWYRFSISEPSEITVTFEGEFGDRLIFGGIMEYDTGRSGSGNCDDIFGGVNPVFNVFECEPAAVTTVCLPAGVYFAFVSPETFEDFPCGDDNAYTLSVTATPCDLPLGACCLSTGECLDGRTVEQCIASNGFYQGDDTECASTACRQPNPGDSCFTPLTIALPADLPYLELNTTCERIDDHRATCLDDYDDGEDIVYRLDVSAPVQVDIRVDPLATPFTGLLLSDTCPVEDGCLAADKATAAVPLELGCLSLEPGTYYLMVDTWPAPPCIEEFELSITACEMPLGACCGGNRGCLGVMTRDECFFERDGAAWYSGVECDGFRCPAEARDQCAEAMEILSLPYFQPDVNPAFFSDDPEVNPACDSQFSCNDAANNGWWYTYTPAVDCTITIDVSGIDSATSLWTGPDCDNLTPLACNADQNATFDLAGGVTHWILISNWACSFEPVELADVTITGTCRAVCGDVAPPGGDGAVDFFDYTAVTAAFASCAGEDRYREAADLDRDGCVTLIDLQQWLECYRTFTGDPDAPPPSQAPRWRSRRAPADRPEVPQP